MDPALTEVWPLGEMERKAVATRSYEEDERKPFSLQSIRALQ